MTNVDSGIPQIPPRRTLARLFTALALITSGLTGSIAAAADRDIQLTTDFAMNGRHAFFFVAIDKGYFAREGLKVTVLPGRGSGATVQEVAAGVTQFGFADAGTMIIARAQEKAPVKMLLAVYDSPLALVYMADSKISTPKDLEGKTIADAASSPMFQFFPEFARRAGIDASKVELISVNSAATTSMLLTGKVDAIGQMSVGVPLLEGAAAPKKVKVFYYRDVGLTMYSSGLIGNEQMIAREPEVARGFVRAVQQGLRDAILDPDTAGRIMNKYNPQIPPEVAAAETRLEAQMVMTPLGKAKGYGYIDPEKMKKTVELVSSITPNMGAVDPQSVFIGDLVAP